MAFIYRFKVQLSNWIGGPGLNIFHSTTGAADDPGDIGNFMNQIANAYVDWAPYLLQAVHCQVMAEVTKHDVETGQLVGVFNIPPPDVVSGLDTATDHSRATQLNCKLLTDAVTDRGKRLAGRHFIGPVGGRAIDGTGLVSTQCINDISGGYQGMLDVAGTCRLVVWHRPADGFTRENGEVVPPSPGSFGHVQSTAVQLRPGVLRSRRDS